MDRATKILLAIGGAIGLYLYLNRQQVTNTAIDIEADVSGWKNVQQGPKWVPYIEFVEQQLGIPPDLLARMAYQESRFREDIITGTTASSAGALGILQLMPAFVDGQKIFAPHTFQFDAVEPQRFHFAKNPEGIVNRGGVSILRDSIKPAATDFHLGLPPGVLEV